MVMKDLSSPSKYHENIYNIQLDGGNKASMTIQVLWWLLTKSLSMVLETSRYHPDTKTDTETDANPQAFLTPWIYNKLN